MTVEVERIATPPPPPPSLLLAVPLLVGAFVVRAWVLCLLWGWYAVPHLGLRPVRFVPMLGLLLLLRCLRPSGDLKDLRRDFMRRLFHAYGVPLMCLVVGWLVLGLQ